MITSSTHQLTLFNSPSHYPAIPSGWNIPQSISEGTKVSGWGWTWLVKLPWSITRDINPIKGFYWFFPVPNFTRNRNSISDRNWKWSSMSDCDFLLLRRFLTQAKKSQRNPPFSSMELIALLLLLIYFLDYCYISKIIIICGGVVVKI